MRRTNNPKGFGQDCPAGPREHSTRKGSLLKGSLFLPTSDQLPVTGRARIPFGVTAGHTRWPRRPLSQRYLVCPNSVRPLDGGVEVLTIGMSVPVPGSL